MTNKARVLKVVLIGFGRMGKRHAAVYTDLPQFDLVGICGRAYQRDEIARQYPEVRFHESLSAALSQHQPDLVCISTHIDTHDELARQAIAGGCHVFLEKPVTGNVTDSTALIKFAESQKRKLIIGHILHHDQLWNTFIDECRKLDRPLEIAIQLDQHSTGEEWSIHQKILKNSTIAADCAIHFFDIMAEALESAPVGVAATSKRTHTDIGINDNFLAAKVRFSDGSTGSYTSGWGPGFEQVGVNRISAGSRSGAVSIVETEDRAEVLVSGNDGSTRVSYSDPDHLEQATYDQQHFVHSCIAANIDLANHHQRTLACMAIAEAVDEAVVSSAEVALAGKTNYFLD